MFLGMVMMLYCPPSCLPANAGAVYGNIWYSEHSSVCGAAYHSGQITSLHGGYIAVTLQRYDYLRNRNGSYKNGTLGMNGITSLDMSAGQLEYS
jgi:hypothetical protein